MVLGVRAAVAPQPVNVLERRLKVLKAAKDVGFLGVPILILRLFRFNNDENLYA